MNGKEHEVFGKVGAIAIPLGLSCLKADSIVEVVTGLDAWMILGGLAGAVFLSPDVDINPAKSGYKTFPLKAWGPLSWIWRPFQAKHRGITHVPVFGSLFMQAYLALLTIASLYALEQVLLEFTNISIQFPTLSEIEPYYAAIVRFSLMITLEQIIHLLLDGALFPKRRKRHQR